VVPVPPVEKGGQRAGAEDDRSSHRPYPRMCFLFDARSPGPFRSADQIAHQVETRRAGIAFRLEMARQRLPGEFGRGLAL